MCVLFFFYKILTMKIIPKCLGSLFAMEAYFCHRKKNVIVTSHNSEKEKKLKIVRC